MEGQPSSDLNSTIPKSFCQPRSIVLDSRSVDFSVTGRFLEFYYNSGDLSHFRYSTRMHVGGAPWFAPPGYQIADISSLAGRTEPSVYCAPAREGRLTF
jgi:hypothetical protein